MRRSLAALWDKEDEEVAPPLRRDDAKMGIDLDKVKISTLWRIRTMMLKSKLRIVGIPIIDY